SRVAMSLSSLPGISFVFSCCDHRDIHSFPTRTLFRSAPSRFSRSPPPPWRRRCRRTSCRPASAKAGGRTRALRWLHWNFGLHPRSEEHTSELQSRENLVCRLLLEKKKNKSKLSRS